MPLASSSFRSWPALDGDGDGNPDEGWGAAEGVAAVGDGLAGVAVGTCRGRGEALGGEEVLCSIRDGDGEDEFGGEEAEGEVDEVGDDHPGDVEGGVVKVALSSGVGDVLLLVGDVALEVELSSRSGERTGHGSRDELLLDEVSLVVLVSLIVFVELASTISEVGDGVGDELLVGNVSL